MDNTLVHIFNMVISHYCLLCFTTHYCNLSINKKIKKLYNICRIGNFICITPRSLP